MNTTAMLFVSVLLVTGPSDDQLDTLADFEITPIEDVRVPAREAGALIALDAKKGQVVQKGQILGHIDDSDAQVRKLIAMNELQAAETTADSDADLKAAIAMVGVAKAEVEGTIQIRVWDKDAVSEFQLRRDNLTYERSQYQADSARVEHEVNRITKGMRAAQLQAVENEIKRRQIEAPIGGVIVDRFHYVGEWAQAGEPIYRLVHMDRLRVEGMVSAEEFTPAEIGKYKDYFKVIVEVPESGSDGVMEIVIDAKIDFVSQVVDAAGEFMISAEFVNLDANGGWLVRPGLDAKVQLHRDLMNLRKDRQQKSLLRSASDDEF